MKLSEVKSGSLFVLEEIPKEAALYKVLMAYGIYRGTTVRVIRNDRWQNMILAQVKEKRVAIRRNDVQTIDVKLVST